MSTKVWKVIIIVNMCVGGGGREVWNKNIFKGQVVWF